jgi:hypothetical protein
MAWYYKHYEIGFFVFFRVAKISYIIAKGKKECLIVVSINLWRCDGLSMLVLLGFFLFIFFWASEAQYCQFQ